MQNKVPGRWGSSLPGLLGASLTPCYRHRCAVLHCSEKLLKVIAKNIAFATDGQHEISGSITFSFRSSDALFRSALRCDDDYGSPDSRINSRRPRSEPRTEPSASI